MGLFDRFRRRRRTLSSNFSSYRNPRLSTRKPFEPKGEVKARSSGLLQRLIRYFKIALVLALFLGMVYTLFFTDVFEIQKINVTGDSDTLEEQNALNTNLQQYLGKNLLTLNVPQIETDLLKEYPYLQTLDVRRDFFHTLTVVLKTYPSVANVRVDYEDGSQQFFVINEEGYISGTGISNESLLTIVMDVTSTDAQLPSTAETAKETTTESTTSSTGGTPVDSSSTESSAQTPTEEPAPFTSSRFELNEELIPKETLELLLDTSKDFTGKFNMQILEIHYLKQARELHLLTERHFTVWIDLTQDINIQLTKLKKSLTTLNIYEANLDYIDLRISGQNGEKVIYRLNE
jgi:hypothetical protein